MLFQILQFLAFKKIFPVQIFSHKLLWLIYITDIPQFTMVLYLIPYKMFIRWKGGNL